MAVRGAGRGHGRGLAADRPRCGAAASGHRIDPGHAGRDRLGPARASRARELDERRRRRGWTKRDDRRPRRLHVQRPSRRRLHARGVQTRLPRQHLRAAPSGNGTAGHANSTHRRPASREAHVSARARRLDHGHGRRRTGRAGVRPAGARLSLRAQVRRADAPVGRHGRHRRSRSVPDPGAAARRVHRQHVPARVAERRGGRRTQASRRVDGGRRPAPAATSRCSSG